jgi:hypothetical protein
MIARLHTVSGAANAAPDASTGTGSNGDTLTKYPKGQTQPSLVLRDLGLSATGLSRDDVRSYCPDLPSAVRTLRRLGWSIVTRRGRPTRYILMTRSNREPVQ